MSNCTHTCMSLSHTHTHTRYIYTTCTFEYSFSLFTSSVCQELEKDELLFLIIIAFTFLFFLLHWIIYIYIFFNNTRSAKPIIYVSHMENLALKENKSKEASLRCPSDSKGIKQIVFTSPISGPISDGYYYYYWSFYTLYFSLACHASATAGDSVGSLFAN